MLPRKQRISRNEFPKKRPEAQITGIFFTLQTQKMLENKPKIAAILSKKNIPTSVERHRIKRIIYDVYTEFITNYPTQITFIIRSRAKIDKGVSKNQIQREVTELFKNIIQQ